VLGNVTQTTSCITNSRDILQYTPALSCSTLGEERYFCYPFDLSGLDPVPHTVSPRSGKGSSLPSGLTRVFSQAGALQHHIRRPALA
jgi:hypothetical protein